MDPPVPQRSRTYSSSMLVRSCRCSFDASYWSCHVFPIFLRLPDKSGAGDGPFQRSPIVESGVEARTFANKTWCREERAYHGRAVAGARVALGGAVPRMGILKQAKL